MYGTIKEEKFNIRNVSFRLLLYVLLLSIIGVLVVHSATNGEVTNTIASTTVKQVIGILAGLFCAAVLTVIDYHKLLKYSWLLYAAALALLLYVYIFADAIYGAKRWIYIPLFGTIQPSEFAKPALIVFLALILYKIGDRINRFYMLVLYMACAMPVLVLVLIEPDLSTSIVIVLLIVSLLFLAGVSYKWIIAVMICMIPVAVLFFIAVYQPGQVWLTSILEEHQVDRINAYFFPEQYPKYVYQQNTSVMAIGSGGLWGKGLNTTSLESVKNGNFLSEEQCDFIFAVVGEELGFVGSMGIILLIALVSFECFRVASKCQDMPGRVIAGGVGAVFASQSFINICVALLLLPNTGIPLPFISAGMSSLISSYIMVGLVMSVSLWGRQKRRVFF